MNLLILALFEVIQNFAAQAIKEMHCNLPYEKTNQPTVPQVDAKEYVK